MAHKDRHYTPPERFRLRHDRHSSGLERTYPGSEYTAEEVEFLRALDAYKRRHDRPFPTACEVLTVLLALGYLKAAPTTAASADADVKHPLTSCRGG